MNILRCGRFDSAGLIAHARFILKMNREKNQTPISNLESPDSVFLTPLSMGGGALYVPPSLFLGLLLKISLDNPYLKILDLANLFAADVPIK